MHIIGIVIASLIVVAVFVLVGRQGRQLPKFDTTAQIPPSPTNDWMRVVYAATVALCIEIDREIWQISTIFMASSMLVMGWVVTNFDKLSAQMIVIIGCASIMLVGMATLLKHRLRMFNLVHIESLKRLEQAAVGGNLDAANYWGVHHIRNCLRAGSNPIRWATSIHGLIDIYLVLFTLIWIALFLIKTPTNPEQPQTAFPGATNSLLGVTNMSPLKNQPIVVSEWDKVKINGSGEIFVNKKQMSWAEFSTECDRLKKIGGAIVLFVDTSNHVASPAQAGVLHKIVDAGVVMKATLKESDLD